MADLEETTLRSVPSSAAATPVRPDPATDLEGYLQHPETYLECVMEQDLTDPYWQGYRDAMLLWKACHERSLLPAGYGAEGVVSTNTGDPS